MADPSEAFHQLYLLTGERDPAVHWQTFCDYDKNRKDLAQSFFGTLTMLTPALKAAQAQGCGVYVAVHEFHGARRKEDLFAIRAIFLDFDNQALPDYWPEEPDLILNTSPGKHQCLWLLWETTEVPIWRCLQRSLQEKYGADKHCRGTTTQVMRLAGSLHLKNRDAPHRVKIVHLAKRRVLKTADWLAAQFDIDLRPEKFERPKRPAVEFTGWDSPVDVATVKRILSDPDRWRLTANGGGIYRIACVCRDFGLSPGMATEIMEELCPIAFADMSHIEDKVDHAYRYAVGEIGEKSFVAALEKVDKAPLDFTPDEPKPLDFGD